MAGCLLLHLHACLPCVAAVADSAFSAYLLCLSHCYHHSLLSTRQDGGMAYANCELYFSSLCIPTFSARVFALVHEETSASVAGIFYTCLLLRHWQPFTHLSLPRAFLSVCNTATSTDSFSSPRDNIGSWFLLHQNSICAESILRHAGGRRLSSLLPQRGRLSNACTRAVCAVLPRFARDDTERVSPVVEIRCLVAGVERACRTCSLLKAGSPPTPLPALPHRCSAGVWRLYHIRRQNDMGVRMLMTGTPTTAMDRQKRKSGQNGRRTRRNTRGAVYGGGGSGVMASICIWCVWFFKKTPHYRAATRWSMAGNAVSPLSGAGVVFRVPHYY